MYSKYSTSYNEEIERAARLIREAGPGATVALTGAGVSTASGIPDFRSPGGLWERYDPSLFYIEVFHERPDYVWNLYAGLVRELWDKKPNPAHEALAKLEEAGYLAAVITQNIDGLHQKAGSRNVIEVHGNAYRARCVSCGSVYPISEALSMLAEGRPPRCSRCGGLLKPDVVFFGEPLPRRAWMEAVRLASTSRVFLVAGSSLVVGPANMLPVYASRNGARLIIVNLTRTPLDGDADIVVRGRVEEVLPRIAELVIGGGQDN